MITIFEQFNSIDPYGEEIWDDSNRIQNIIKSIKDGRTKCYRSKNGFQLIGNPRCFILHLQTDKEDFWYIIPPTPEIGEDGKIDPDSIDKIDVSDEELWELKELALP